MEDAPPRAAVLSDLPIPLAVAGHYHPAPFWLTRDAFGGMPVEIAGGEIVTKVGTPVADSHRHQVPEVYFLISPTPGGATIDVEVEGEHHVVSSPALVYVPVGAEHRFLTLAAEPGSYCFGILLGVAR